MAQSRYTLEQYTAALKALLPRGRVWPRSLITNMHQLMEGFAKSFQQLDADAVQLLIDAFPSTTTALLDEWNQTVGIPDYCFGAPESIEQNRQYIVAKLIADGGQTNSYYESIAESLGLKIVIREFSLNHYDGDAPVGMITKPEDWCYTFKVVLDINSPNLIPLQGDEDAIRASTSYKALSCLLNRYKPAHTQFYISLFDFNDTDEHVFGFSEDAEPFNQGMFYKK